ADVGAVRGPGTELPREARAGGRSALELGAHDLVDRDTAERDLLVLVQASHPQQCAQVLGGPGAFAAQVDEQLLLLGRALPAEQQGINGGADPGERRAQLVGGRRKELLAPALGLARRASLLDHTV